jgi:hypothetical protein
VRSEEEEGGGRRARRDPRMEMRYILGRFRPMVVETTLVVSKIRPCELRGWRERERKKGKSVSSGRKEGRKNTEEKTDELDDVDHEGEGVAADEVEGDIGDTAAGGGM